MFVAWQITLKVNVFSSVMTSFPANTRGFLNCLFSWGSRIFSTWGPAAPNFVSLGGSKLKLNCGRQLKCITLLFLLGCKMVLHRRREMKVWKKEPIFEISKSRIICLSSFKYFHLPLRALIVLRSQVPVIDWLPAQSRTVLVMVREVI